MKPDRAKNIEIILRKMKLEKSFQQLKEVFLVYDPDFINEEVVGALQNIMPTPKERVDYAKVVIKEDENWNLADQYIKFACSIISYEEKAGAILFKCEYEESMKLFFDKLEQFCRFYDELQQDLFFQTFLEYFLAMGNILNAGTFRGNFKSFRIENIDKSYLLIGQDNETSFFECVLG